jgi:hypothetical protein
MFFAALIISSIGFVAFSYGKGRGGFAHMLIGLALMLYPYFVGNVWLFAGIALALIVLLWIATQRGW